MSTATGTGTLDRPLEAIVRAKREEILAIAARYGVRNIRLFGSVARGAEHPGSDVDLLVEAEPSDFRQAVRMADELEALLGCRVDVIPEKSLVALIRPAVLASALPLDRPLPYIPPADPSVVVKGDRLYLEHIRESTRRVEKIATEGRAAFMDQVLLQDAALHNLQTLAESTQKLSAAAKAAHPEIDWKEWAGFRNRVAHGYFDIDLDIVWKTIENDLPPLKAAVIKLLTGE